MEFDRACAARGERVLSGKEELQNLLLWLERWTGVGEERAADDKSYLLKIRVCQESAFIPARVRVYADTGSLSDRIPVTRTFTAGISHAPCRAEGKEKAPDEVSVSLGTGEFLVEAAWGPAYCRFKSRIHMPKDDGKTLEIHPEPIGELPEGWKFGDLHHHSIYSSPVYGGTDAVTETAAEAARAMRAAGCSFGALSDHHNIFNHEDWSKEKRTDFCPLLSKEISTSNGHIMALEVRKDIIYHIPEGESRTEENLKQEFVRVAVGIHGEGGIVQLNHPFDTSASTSWNQRFDDIIDRFDAAEIYNGAHPMLKDNGNGRAVDWWIRLCRKGYRLTGTGGSDTHNIWADQFDEDLHRICGMLELISQEREDLPSGIREKVDIFEKMGRRSLPHFLDWAGNKLGSACVKTCVQAGKDADAGQILQAIQEGRCMVTDGPLLFVNADGAGPGEQRSCLKQEVFLQVRIFSEELPEKLLIFLEDGRTLERTEFIRKGRHEYFLEERALACRQAKWMICALESRAGYRAVTNPVYL